MAFIYTLLVLVGLLLLSLLRYLYLGWEVKKLLEYFSKKDNIDVKPSNQDKEIFVSGHYTFNNRSGLIVVVADSAGLIFRRFLLFSLLIEWCSINRISIFEDRAKIYFEKENNSSNVNCISVPWNQHMTEALKGQVALFKDD